MRVTLLRTLSRYIFLRKPAGTKKGEIAGRLASHPRPVELNSSRTPDQSGSNGMTRLIGGGEERKDRRLACRGISRPAAVGRLLLVLFEDAKGSVRLRI
jgi:hypothetical protein